MTSAPARMILTGAYSCDLADLDLRSRLRFLNLNHIVMNHILHEAHNDDIIEV